MASSTFEIDGVTIRWLWVKLAIAMIVLVIGSCVGYNNCVNFVDNYELGYKYDMMTGRITVLPRSGYFITPPWVVSVHTVDLRPMQVCITGGNNG